MQWEKVETVRKMQLYIKKHVEANDFNLDELYSNIGYSKRHANRIFKELIGKTLLEYIRAIKMSNSTQFVKNGNESILEIALNTDFDSHEGYTRAFNEAFGTTPNKYRKAKMPIPLFVQYPINHYYSYLYNKEISSMSKEVETKLCMVSMISKPKRKLIIMRAKKAHDYWSFCEEKGCEWEGLFNSIDSKLDSAAILDLPPNLTTEGTTNCAAGVEIPMDYDGPIPVGCECLTLEACDMLYFQSEPFDSDDDFGLAIGSVFKAIETYNPLFYGFEYKEELAPKFNYGAAKETGARQAIPVLKITR